MFSVSSSDSDEQPDDDVINKNKNKNSFSAVAAAAAATHARSKRLLNKNTPSADEINAALSAPTPPQNSLQTSQATVRTSKYIGKLVRRAEERKDEARLIEDRRLARDDPNTEKFVTPAYSRALAAAAATEGDESTSVHTTHLRHRTLQPTKRGRRSRFERAAAGTAENASEDANGDLDKLKSSKSHGLVRDDATATAGSRQRDYEGENRRERSGHARVHDDETSEYLATATHPRALLSSEASDESAAPLSKRSPPSAPHVAKRARRSRFGAAAAAANADGTTEQTRKSAKVRGLRRNDDKAIEAYRERYFEREKRREMRRQQQLGRARVR